MTGATATFAQQAFAANPGVYVVTTQPTYDNPKTGTIEDRGANEALGQSMVTGVLTEQALLEVSTSGKTYLTLRIALMDNIEEIRISYQVEGQEDFTAAEYTVTKENLEDYESDVRFEVPDETVLLRLEFYVIPMGRDIIFFATVANPVAGEGDFVVDENLNATEEIGSEEEEVHATDNSDEANNTVMFYLAIGVGAIVVIAAAGFIVYRTLGKKPS